MTPNYQTLQITCPECQGCIHLEIDSKASFAVYRCQVGHTYSLAEVIKGKEIQLENHIWTILGLIEHLEWLYGRFIQEKGDASSSPGSDIQTIRERLEGLKRHTEILRNITRENTPPPINGD